MSNSCFNRDFLISLLSYDIMCPGPLCLMVSGVGSLWANVHGIIKPQIEKLPYRGALPFTRKASELWKESR